MNDTHTSWMRQAIELALCEKGRTHPNPCVGALLVRNNRCIGRGFHRQAGKAHAEIEAIADAKKRGWKNLRGTTLYVTLEPCSSHGRTPPCVEAILREGVRRIVFGSIDPDPRHAGRGIRLLQSAGVEVIHGVCEEECRLMNLDFEHRCARVTPWIILKLALTLDGFLDQPPERGRWITGVEARRHAHQLRASCDAILVGAETVRRDNPRLTVRGVQGASQPLRIVLGRKENLPPNCNLLTDAHAQKTWIVAPDHLSELSSPLMSRGVHRLLVEGGAKVARSFLKAGLVHEVYLYYAQMSTPRFHYGTLKRMEGLPLDRFCATRAGKRSGQIYCFMAIWMIRTCPNAGSSIHGCRIGFLRARRPI